MAQPAADESDEEMAYSSNDDDNDNDDDDDYSVAFDHFACSFCSNPIAGYMHLHYRYSVNTANGVRDIGIFSGVNNVLIDYGAVEGYGAAVTVYCLTCLSFLGWKLVNLVWSSDPSFRNGRFVFIMDKLSLSPDPPPE